MKTKYRIYKMNTKAVCCVFLAVMLSYLVSADFNPEVSISDCTSKRVVIKLSNASEGGIMYIQGKGSACRQTTVAATRVYEFNFELCQLKYDVKFRLIIQKNPDVQTGHDKVIPVTCFVDMGTIVVGDSVNPIDSDNMDIGVNKTVKPTARMTIRTNTSGDTQTARLTDTLSLQVLLDEEYRDDFAIKAKECTAATIKILADDCSMNRDLFPDFIRQDSGSLEAQFEAFIPTDMAGNYKVKMSYTCTLVVCRGSCSQTLCGQFVGWGRKKRDTNDEDEDRITVGTSISIITAPEMEEEMKADNLCVEKPVAYLTILSFSVLLLFSWVVSIRLYLRMRKYKPDIDHINVARRVGRRLSAMLNIPTNYELKDQNKLQIIPEDMGTPPKRRKSVTVSCLSQSMSTQTEPTLAEIELWETKFKSAHNIINNNNSAVNIKNKNVNTVMSRLSQSHGIAVVNCDESSDESDSYGSGNVSDNLENKIDEVVNDKFCNQDFKGGKSKIIYHKSFESDSVGVDTYQNGKWKTLTKRNRYILDLKLKHPTSFVDSDTNSSPGESDDPEYTKTFIF